MPAAASDSRIITFPGRSATTPSTRRRRTRPHAGAIEARLAMLAKLAPAGSVSVLVVTFDGSLDAAGRRLAEEVVRGQVRATDSVASVSKTQLGIVLQGAATTRAAEVAARVGRALRQEGGFRPGSVMVSAATGTGQHGPTLLAAASSSLPDCG